MIARKGLLRALVTRRLAVVAALWLGLAGSMAAAQQPAAKVDLFTITGVKVDVTAQSASAARNQALAEGQRKAFDLLMRRLLRQEDRASLPPVEPVTLNALIQGLEIFNERTSSVRYLADFTVRFDGARVQNYLRIRGVPFSQTAGRPVLVVPVMETAGLRLLWEEENAWRAAWNGHDLENRLLTFLLPKGDADDRRILAASQALDMASPSVARLASRYGVDRVITPVLEVSRDFVTGGLKARVDMIGADESLGELPSEFDLAVPAEEEAAAEAGEGASTAPALPQLDSVTPEMLAPVVEALVAAMDDQWKEQTLIRLDESGEMELVVPLRTAADWPEVGRRLAQVTLVQGRELRSLRPGEAVILLKYVGTRERVALGLAQANLLLHERDGRDYLLLHEIAQDLGISVERPKTRTPEMPPATAPQDSVTDLPEEPVE